MTGGASPSRAATSGHDSRPGTSCNGSVEEVAPVASAAAVGLSSPTPTSSAADSDAHAPAPQPPNAMNALHQPRSTSPAGLRSPSMSVSVSTSTGDSRAARAGPSAGTNSPKKRRKVNHACVYCRRSHMTCDSERPCTRCLKRNIGHLCHDEPRDGPRRRPDGSADPAVPVGAGPGVTTVTASNAGSTEEPIADGGLATTAVASDTVATPGTAATTAAGRRASVACDTASHHNHRIRPESLLDSSGLSLPPTAPVTSASSTARSTDPSDAPNPSLTYSSWPLATPTPFQDMRTFHPPYMFNAPEVSNEYNLLSDFLSSSLLDNRALYPADDMQNQYWDPPLLGGLPTMNPAALYTQPHPPMAPHPSQYHRSSAAAGLTPSLSPIPQPATVGSRNANPSNTTGADKARETYYMTAADPSGTEPAEVRMNKLLKAKYDAGLLKPFNYVNGYARLYRYMEQRLKPASRHHILRQLDKFRPKFRERMQSLTDIELVWAEMWFERCLMEYDRVFASMAIPACCWRRTGQIFRGNKEFAKLIDVPIESLRDGKLAIHEIIEEDNLVSYWEHFGSIAFDNKQKAMLTSCTLKNPTRGVPYINCCFSFTIRRDNHNIPSLIVGNFLPKK